jgi:hypothetical protein
MQPARRAKSADQLSHSSGSTVAINASKNPLNKIASRPSSGVGVLLLDVIGHDVKVRFQYF